MNQEQGKIKPPRHQDTKKSKKIPFSFLVPWCLGGDPFSFSVGAV
jgi:hypothetical protein